MSNPPPPTPYILTNPYRAKKTWPPNLSELSQIQQFRFERRYRRRSKLKWARPVWTKGVKIAQLGLVSFVTVYGVLFMDWKQPEGAKVPFEGTRKAFHDMTGSIWTNPERGLKRQANDDASPIAVDASK